MLCAAQVGYGHSVKRSTGLFARRTVPLTVWIILGVQIFQLRQNIMPQPALLVKPLAQSALRHSNKKLK